MAQINFGGVNETVVTREEFPLEKARKVLDKNSKCYFITSTIWAFIYWFFCFNCTITIITMCSMIFSKLWI